MNLDGNTPLEPPNLLQPLVPYDIMNHPIVPSGHCHVIFTHGLEPGVEEKGIIDKGTQGHLNDNCLKSSRPCDMAKFPKSKKL